MTARKPKRKSPTARALEDLRKMGFVADVVERRLPRCFITKDFFGCIDIIAARPGIGILAVQATGGDGGNHAARIAKSIAEARLRTWLLSGGRFEVWSYRLAGARGARKTYTLRRQEITLADLPAEPTEPGEQTNLFGAKGAA